MVKPIINTCRLSLYLAICILCLISPALCTAADLDETKYFPFDQVQPGMDAYCLSVMQGTTIQKYPIKIVSKIENYKPGQNRIVIIGTDETFQHVGPVQGCSGSPVYIDNRIAGALSAGFSMSKDPIYLVTPIEEMLAVGKTNPDMDYPVTASDAKLNIDFTKPINLTSVNETLLSTVKSQLKNASSLNQPVSLVTSLPESACSELSTLLKPLNVIPVSGVTNSTPLDFASDEEAFNAYKPGSVLTLALVFGDISISAVGTVTEVVDDTVYAFGHDFLGQGTLNVPMSTGYIHTVVPNLDMSFKLGTPSRVSGTLVCDELTGVVGKIGQEPKLIPLNIVINRYNDTQARTYNCRLLNHTLYSPTMLQTAISGAAQMKGPLPEEHTILYKLRIGLKNFDPIFFGDISSDSGLGDPVANASGVVSLIMSNPFKETDITSIDVEINITNKSTYASISSVEASDLEVKAGDTIDLDILLERFKASKSLHKTSIKVPNNLAPGKYSILVLGGSEYESVLQKLALHKYTATSLPTLIEAIRNLSNTKHSKIYVVMPLPSDGITINEKELPHLPDTKTLLLSNQIRTTEVKPYNPWIETSIDTDLAIEGAEEITFTVIK